jgi:hypothetical protein
MTQTFKKLNHELRMGRRVRFDPDLAGSTLCALDDDGDGGGQSSEGRRETGGNVNEDVDGRARERCDTCRKHVAVAACPLRATTAVLVNLRLLK